MNFLEAEQPLVFNTINNMIKRRHVPHALIFYGDKSTSKYEMSIYFTKELYKSILDLSDDSNVLDRIDKNIHSNVTIIEPGINTLSKDTIESIIFDSNISSLEDGPKVYIFKDSDKLNQSSSNSLLKFIEEPSSDVYIIFLVDNLSNIISTIKSRCVLLSFRQLNKDLLKEKLTELGYEKLITNILIEYTQNIDLIKSIIEDEEYMEILNFIPNLFMEPFEKNGSMILTLKEKIELIESNPDYIDFFLTLFVLYLKDILNYNINKADDFIFSGEKYRIKELSKIYSEDELSSFIKDILEDLVQDWFLERIKSVFAFSAIGATQEAAKTAFVKSTAKKAGTSVAKKVVIGAITASVAVTGGVVASNMIETKKEAEMQAACIAIQDLKK